MRKFAILAVSLLLLGGTCFAVVFYDYSSIASSPDYHSYTSGDTLESGVRYDVENSAMENKNIQGFRWDENTQLLRIHYDLTLSGTDEGILDTAVSNNT